jgi:5'-methylthioadenosine phosphorylase
MHLKSLGVERIVSISACGSLREDYVPWRYRHSQTSYSTSPATVKRSFFEGAAWLPTLARPIPSAKIFPKRSLRPSVRPAEPVHHGGDFITIEGPRFSTKSESNTYRAWGMSIIGMTTSPEAFLAREAEMCYAVMAHVTDYDVWHISEEPVTVRQW